MARKTESMLRNSDRAMLAKLDGSEVVECAARGDAAGAVDAFFRVFAAYAYDAAKRRGKFRAPGVSLTVDEGIARRKPGKPRKDEAATIQALAGACGDALTRAARTGDVAATLECVADATARYVTAQHDLGAAWCIPYVLACVTVDGAESNEAAREQAWKEADRKVRGA